MIYPFKKVWCQYNNNQAFSLLVISVAVYRNNQKDSDDNIYNRRFSRFKAVLFFLEMVHFNVKRCDNK